MSRREEVIQALDELDHIQDMLDDSLPDTDFLSDSVGHLKRFLLRELAEIETRLLSRTQAGLAMGWIMPDTDHVIKLTIIKDGQVMGERVISPTHEA